MVNRGLGSWLWTVGLAASLAFGCKESGAPSNRASGNQGEAGETASSSNGGAAPQGVEPQAVPHAIGFDGFAPQGLVAAAGGEGGAGPQPIVAPYGISTECGDGIVGADEECDDGAGGAADACTSACQTRDQPVGPATAGRRATGERYLGVGRHPVSGLAGGFIATYVDAGGEEPVVAAKLFDIWGHPAQVVAVSDGASPLDEANPVAAALPGGKYAVAWSDFDGDGSDLGVALRLVAANGTLGPLSSANSQHEYSQLNPDVLWTGQELVVAWEDYSDASNGPDLRFSTFDADLNPSGPDQTLADSSLPEAAVALALFNDSWAAAYREGAADGAENIVVRVGDDAFRVGPFWGGPLDDRPALVALDDTHLLVAFSAGTPATGSDPYNLPRLRYSVIDTASAAAPTIRSLDPLDDHFTADDQTAQLSPSAELADGGVYLAWRSEGRPGDAAGDQIWLKYLPWDAAGASAQLDVEQPEMLIPRTCDESLGDQRIPALGRSALPPGGALVVAWEDYGRNLANAAGPPDVLVHYAPTHLTAVGTAPRTVTETWSGPKGAAWPAHWSSLVTGPLAPTALQGEADFYALQAPASAEFWINDHTALNSDIVTTVRFQNVSQYGGIIARRADDNPDTYLGAYFLTHTPNPWVVYAMIEGTFVPIKTFPLPLGFAKQGVGTGVNHRLRFRVLNNADGSLFLGMKLWRVGAAEPANWLMQETLPTTSDVVTKLGNVAGRFGLWAKIPTANGGHLYFDDYRAKFFEGSGTGDLDAPQAIPLLLPRSNATYRHCNGSSPCAQAAGCCGEAADCQTGLACTPLHAVALGLGSHASVCVNEHCANSKRDAGETRADSGGPDCPASECTSTLTPGVAGYCAAPCLCGIGEYPCLKNGDCLPGLLCGVDVADVWGGGAADDACVPPHCMNRIQDADETAADCGGSCGTNCNLCSSFANGAIGHCRVFCPCSLGHGTCRTHDECANPLICAESRGNRFGFVTATNVCVPLHCINNIKEAALGETSIDCGGACGCGGCAAGCTTNVPPIGAVVAIPTTTPYSETFDSIGNAGVATLPDGWRIDKQASPRVVGAFSAAGTTTIMRVGAAMSSGSTNSIYNFGAGVAAAGAGYWLNAADRAVGWLATGATVGSGGTKSGNLYVQLQAPASTNLKSLTVSYGVEKYRNGSTAPGWKIQLFYSADGVNWASAGTNFTTSFAADADSNGFDPAPASSTAATGTFDAYIPSASTFYLAWNYTTSSPTTVDATNAQALAIDDVTIVGTPTQ